MRKHSFAWLGTITTVAALSGCGTVDKIHGTVDSATEQAVYGVTGPRSSGEQTPAAGSGGGAPPPAAIHGYAMGLFQAVFYQGGYSLPRAGFEPGEYVQWEAQGAGDAEWFEKALLKRKDDGSEWWRVASHTSSGPIVMEALFGPAGASGDRSIRRLRVKWPDQERPEEVPITEEDSEKWVLNKHRTLTEESYAGLKVGVEEVTVPAGTFTADHLRTSHPGRGGTVHWWITEQVPGEVVKYRWEGNGDQQVLSLKEYGDDAGGSRLGAF